MTAPEPFAPALTDGTDERERVAKAIEAEGARLAAQHIEQGMDTRVIPPAETEAGA